MEDFFLIVALVKKICNGELNLPANEALQPGGNEFPYVFIGDQAFPLLKKFLRPYSKTACRDSREKRTFNYRHSRARNVVENAFGILATIWRIYRRPIACRLDTMDEIVKATCVLHNYLLCKGTLPRDINYLRTQ